MRVARAFYTTITISTILSFSYIFCFEGKTRSKRYTLLTEFSSRGRGTLLGVFFWGKSVVIFFFQGDAVFFFLMEFFVYNAKFRIKEGKISRMVISSDA